MTNMINILIAIWKNPSLKNNLKKSDKICLIGLK